MVLADQLLDAKVVRIGRSATEHHQVAKVSMPMDRAGTRHVCLERLRIENNRDLLAATPLLGFLIHKLDDS
jgi:hypothetical protein